MIQLYFPVVLIGHLYLFNFRFRPETKREKMEEKRRNCKQFNNNNVINRYLCILYRNCFFFTQIRTRTRTHMMMWRYILHEVVDIYLKYPMWFWAYVRFLFTFWILILTDWVRVKREYFIIMCPSELFTSRSKTYIYVFSTVVNC